MSREVSAVLLATACCSLALLGLAQGSMQADLPRGSDPSLSALYSAARTSGRFTCKDGSRSVPLASVNDDFCDCVDGSDEPGTPACPRGTFYCKNRGHEPKVLHSGFVNDGVCDCCDGSDEPKGSCPNECLASAKAEVEELEKRTLHYNEGLKKRQEYIEKAAELKKSWALRLDELEAEIDSHSNSVAELRVKKEAIEAEEEKAREAERREREAREAEEAARDAEGRTEADGEADGDLYPPGDQPKDEEDGYPGDDPDELEYDKQAPYGEEAEEEDPEEVGRRIASRWTSDPEAAGGEEDDQEGQGEGYGEGEDPDYEGRYDEYNYDDHEANEHRSGAGGEEDNVYGNAEGGNSNLESEGDKARAEFRSAEADLRALESERTKLTSKLSSDYGPDSAFAPLDSHCFSAAVDKYTYEVCLFGDATQKEGHSKVSLGKWMGGLHMSELVFEGGQSCWQGPKRSMRVKLQCGSAEQLHSVEEPSRCEYAAVLSTPAACSTADLDASNVRIGELKAMLKEVHDEL